MRAIVHDRYGSPDFLHLEEVEKPSPADDEILVRVRAVSVNGSDREGVEGRPLYARMGGLLKPGHRILGSDIAGTVEAAGRNVTEFKPGDEVYGEIPGYHGGFAEYVCTNGSTMAHKPAGLGFEEAAAIPQGGVIALRGIRDRGNVQPGDEVLINGAGGSAGTFAVQLAKLAGGVVTGVDNAGKLDLLRSLGCDHVIDYAREDFTKGGRRYDLVLDLVARRSVFAWRRALKPGGVYFFVGGSVGVIFQILVLGPLIRWTGGVNVRMLVVPQNRDDLVTVTGLCESGKIRPVIDRRYPFVETPEALRYVVEGRARGKVVITL